MRSHPSLTRSAGRVGVPPEAAVRFHERRWRATPVAKSQGHSLNTCPSPLCRSGPGRPYPDSSVSHCSVALCLVVAVRDRVLCHVLLRSDSREWKCPRQGLLMSSTDERFLQIYGTYYKEVHAYCRRRTTADGADDATAETFLVAWRKIDR